MAKRRFLALFVILLLPANAALSLSPAIPAPAILAPAMAAPDLVPAAFVVPAAGVAGRLLDVSWTVQNQGDGPAVAEWGGDNTGWRDGVYFSTDATLDGGDVWLGSVWRTTTLQPGETYTHTLAARLPAVAPGGYYLLLQVDETARVPEADEGNNVLAAPVTVRVPDLAPAALDPPAAGVAGRLLDVTWTVQNQGDGAAIAEWGGDNTGWRDGVYFSTDATLDGGDTWLGSVWRTTTLQPGETYTPTLAARLPAVARGVYYLLLQVDETGRVPETDEANNVLAEPVTVRVPDLAPAALVPPAAGVAGRLMDVTWTVQNQGDGAAIPEWGGDDTGWRDGVFFSTDATLDAGDTRLGWQWKRDTAPPGGTYTQTLSVRLPAVASGVYYLLLQVDETGRVVETDEANNVLAAPVTVRVPDLAPVVLLPPPAGPGARWVSVSWTVRNQGDGPAIPEWGGDDTGWRDGVFFSTDATLDAGDARLGWLWKRDTVPPGGMYTQTLSVPLPAVASGAYYLLLHVDETARVYETSEANNVLAVPVVIAWPDLAPAALSAPAEATAGEAIGVSWIVRNDGVGEAVAPWSDRLYLSPDEVWDAEDVQLGPNWTHPQPLAGGASDVRSAQVALPAVPAGHYTLIFKADVAGEVAETDEANNETRRTVQIRAAGGPGAGLVLSGWGPRTISPGQTLDVLLGYRNETDAAVAGLIVVAQLPADGDYVSSTGGGLYWRQRRQVVWNVGDVPAGEAGVLSVRLRYGWGLPDGRQEVVVATPATQAVPNPAVDWGQYQEFIPITGGGPRTLPAGEVSALLAGDPELAALLAQAEGQGFRFDGAAYEQSVSDGTQLVQLWLLDQAGREAMTISRQDGQRLVTRFGTDTVTIGDGSGGLTWSAETETVTTSGTWAEPAVAGCGTGTAVPPTYGRCLSNCFQEELPASLLGELIGKLGTAFTVRDCWRCFWNDHDPDSCVKCAAGVSQQVGLGVVIDVAMCRRDCTADPNSHICSASLTYCPGDNWFWQGFNLNYRGVKPCDTSTGLYGPVQHFPCELGQRCMGGACLPQPGPEGCTGDACGTTIGGTVTVARDPNAKYGPAEVVPGQPLTYTIEYENEGEGTAYGVFVEDALPAALDEATLRVGGGGVYLPDSRTLVWTPGEVAPGAGGSVTFTTQVPAGLVSGTEIANVATVFFPSVPEETPTNPIVTIVRPAVAVPQAITTTEDTPVAVTLAGRAAGGAPLGYELVDGPRNGTLAGTPPDLVYTPAAGFEGLDRLSFAVTSGATRSAPAEVGIEVQPGPETVPPEIVATEPADGETGVAVSSTPLYSGVYPPFVWARFSEPMRATSVTSETLFVVDDRGARLPGRVVYDAAGYAARFEPEQPLRPGATYTVTAAAGLEDTSGNPLAGAYHWSFRTQPGLTRVYLPVVVKKG